MFINLSKYFYKFINNYFIYSYLLKIKEIRKVVFLSYLIDL